MYELVIPLMPEVNQSASKCWNGWLERIVSVYSQGKLSQSIFGWRIVIIGILKYKEL